MARTNLITQLTAAVFAVATLSTGASFAVEQTSWGQLKQTLGTEAPRPAAKPTQDNQGQNNDGRTVSDTFTPSQQGRLLIEQGIKGQNPDDDLRVTFDVLRDGVNEAVDITMTVTGDSLEDLVISFQPAGLVFNIPAQLEIRLGAERFTSVPETFTIYHEYSDGTVEEAVFNVTNQGGENFLMIQIEVPGFSRYSPGGGW